MSLGGKGLVEGLWPGRSGSHPKSGLGPAPITCGNSVTHIHTRNEKIKDENVSRILFQTPTFRSAGSAAFAGLGLMAERPTS